MKKPLILTTVLTLAGCAISTDPFYQDLKDCQQEARNAVAPQQKDIEKQCMIKRGHRLPQNQPHE
jgi:Tfp pilus assembly protein PilP